MKAMLIYLSFFFLLISSQVIAQNIKIGDITLSDSLAKEYLIDCYNKPDTVTFSYVRSLDHKEKYFFYKHNLGVITMPDNYIKQAYLFPRTPSAFDFMLFMNRKYKGVKK